MAPDRRALVPHVVLLLFHYSLYRRSIITIKLLKNLFAIIGTIVNVDENETQLSETPQKPGNEIKGDNGSMTLSHAIIVSVVALIALV